MHMMTIRIIIFTQLIILIGFGRLGRVTAQEEDEVPKDFIPSYLLISQVVEEPQWLDTDAYDFDRYMKNKKDRETIRIPHEESRYIMTRINQDPILLSSKDIELIPNCSTLLQINKTPRRYFYFRPYSPIQAASSGMSGAHKLAETLGLRERNFAASDAQIIPFLYYPTGWPLLLSLVFFITLIMTPLFGSLLVHGGFEVALVYNYVLWNPLKLLMRYAAIRYETMSRKWTKFLAPDYYLEPRGTWKLRYFLRNDVLEDVPPELSYKPPLNTIDYTLYILTEEDYDELDLSMDELEFINEMLPFRDIDAKIVSRLLKHRLGIDKFYYYFEEEPDLPPEYSSTASEHDHNNDPSSRKSKKLSNAKRKSLRTSDQHDDELMYAMVITASEEPWMLFPEADEPDALRKKRETLKELKRDIVFLHEMIQLETKSGRVDKEFTRERLQRYQKQLRKLMNRYLTYCTMCREKMKTLKSRLKVQPPVTLSKYLPLTRRQTLSKKGFGLRREEEEDLEGGPKAPQEAKPEENERLEMFDWP